MYSFNSTLLIVELCRDRSQVLDGQVSWDQAAVSALSPGKAVEDVVVEDQERLVVEERANRAKMRCELRGRLTGEMPFHQRWVAASDETFDLCVLCFVSGVIVFCVLSVVVTYITSFNHPARDGATAVSAVVLLSTVVITVPILLEETPRLLSGRKCGDDTYA